jgi:hypothetical protein
MRESVCWDDAGCLILDIQECIGMRSKNNQDSVSRIWIEYKCECHKIKDPLILSAIICCHALKSFLDSPKWVE